MEEVVIFAFRKHGDGVVFFFSADLKGLIGILVSLSETLQSVHIYELPQLHFVTQNNIVLVGGKTDVNRMWWIRYFYVESMFRPEILLVELGRDNVGDLKKRAEAHTFSGVWATAATSFGTYPRYPTWSVSEEVQPQ